MEKIITLAFLLLLPFSEVLAQFRVGPLAGIGVSRFIYDDHELKTGSLSAYNPGFNVGAMLNYKVSRLYSLHTELSVQKKGIDVSKKYDYGVVNNKAHFYYLSVPALLRFSFPKRIGDQQVEFYVNIGPEVNYWLGGNGTLKTQEPAAFVIDEILKYKVRFKEDDLYDRYMMVEEPFRIQMSLAAGGGILFDMGKDRNLAVDARGSFGLGKSFHGRSDGGDYGLELHRENLEGVHHSINISVAYIVNLDLNSILRKGKVLRAP